MTDPRSTVRTMYWDAGALMLLDQRRLPHSIEYLRCACAGDVAAAISAMVVRGAPAIGIAAAYGVVLAVKSAYAASRVQWIERAEPDIQLLKSSRPTAVNLGWAIDRIVGEFCQADSDPSANLLRVAERMFEADIAANKAMGDYGAGYLETNAKVITHCNAGALATAGYGTALGVVRSAWRNKKLARVFATETRPWFQGSRLTAWELQQDAIPVTLIADSAAAQLMAREHISWIITGADRIAANGDVANKIGTYSLALCARAHGIRFMVAAPLATIDRGASTGDDIPIEERAADELLTYNECAIAPPGVAAYNPVFDVTPAALIDVLVTEKGAIEKPDQASIRALFES